MYKLYFDGLSIGEFWTLYEQVEAILARRLIAKKQELEARLERLRLTHSQMESLDGNESFGGQ